MSELDDDVVNPVRIKLGSAYDKLLEVMVDLATPPIFLFHDDRARVVALRAEAVAILDGWEQNEPGVLAALAAGLPDVLQLDSPCEALLKATTWSSYFELPEAALGPPDPESRVLRAVPGLLARLDADGLVDISGLDARPHGLLLDGYSLHYHQFLRRGFSSNIHYELIGKVLGLADRHGLTARLAIDDRRLRQREEHQEVEEKDFWYGKPLSDRFLDDVHEVGETFHGDRAGGLSILNPYAGLSVRWTADGHLKTVEIEEFMPPPEAGQEWVLARYLHAIRDTHERAFIHCDGAVKAYKPATYPAVQGEFARRGKGDHYRKLFRVDGSLTSEEWSQLAASWFRGNRLILEYLDSRAE